ncbi:MAG TPA: AraC family transcriptional regulator [bacterium]|nr:AraC family transcriptional regulator [bacterium]
MRPFPETFHRFLHYKPFHGIIHYYVDLSVFLITSGQATGAPQVWWSLNRRKGVSNLFTLEVRYQGSRTRDRYTRAHLLKAGRAGRTVVGERNGFKDLFVPILKKGRVLGFLQAGAYSDHETTFEDLVRCWKAISGRGYSPDLPELRSFAQGFLEIPILDGALGPALAESLELFAKLLAEEGEPDAVGERLLQLQNDVFSKGLPHSYWLDWALGRPTNESVPAWGRSMETWDWTQNEIGLTRVPTTALAVIPQRTSGDRLDRTAEAFRIRRFQRRSFQFARNIPQTVGGKLEDYGAVFVTSADPRGPRLMQKRTLEETARKIRDFAVREWGGPVLVGVGDPVAPGEPLHASFRQAVFALHLGHEEGSDIIFHGPGPEKKDLGGFDSLRVSLDRLEEAFQRAAFSELAVLKDRFLRQAIETSFQNPGEIQWHLQYALDRLGVGVAERMDLSARDSSRLRERLSRPLALAASFQEMLLAFQGGLESLEREVEGKAGEGDLSLEAAREFIDKHFKEVLPIGRLAKKAGCSVPTFSRRFKRSTGLGLGDYLQRKRLAESKRLLRTTRLPVLRVAKDCGFRSVPYFIQLFKARFGKTPQEFRKSPDPG